MGLRIGRWLLCAAGVILSGGCSEGPEQVTGPPQPPPQQPPPTASTPALPSAASLTIDVAMLGAEPRPDDEPSHSWWRAAGRFGEPRMFADALLGFPRAVLLAAADVSPVGTGEQWTWQVATSSDGSAVAARIVASWDGAEVVWETRATIPDHGIYDLVLFTGRSDADAANGAWSIKDVQGAPVEERATVVWQAAGDDDWNVQFAARGWLLPSDSAWTRYARSGRVATMRHRQRIANAVSEFEAGWDAETRRGWLRLTGPPEETVCWGERLEDVPCPS